VSVEEECNLVQFCSKISDLVENGDDRNGQLWSDVHPVLTYLLSKYFPANIVPASVKNALRAISFRSYKNENFYQVNDLIPSVLNQMSPFEIFLYLMKCLQCLNCYIIH